MDREILAIGFIFALLGLLALGIPIGVVILILAGIGIMLVSQIDIGSALATAFYSQLTTWSLTALPLFVLMGEILGRSGVAERLFASFSILLGRLPGGLLQVNVVASAMFSALSGSSTATVATIGKLSYPQLQERGYSRRLSLGSLAGAGTLGILIPPSVALILYGFTFDVSISELFLAGVLPGVMIAVFFSAYLAFFRVPQGDSTVRVSGRDRLGAATRLVPFLVLVVIVFGSIYGGYATPTESAVIGVVGAIILAALNRTLAVEVLIEALKATVLFSAAIGFVLAASAALQIAMAYTGIPRTIVAWIEAYELGYYTLLLVIAAILVVLGCFIDGLSMIVLTSAVLQPAVTSAGIDLLWFGVFLVILVEIGLITPPIGFNLFVLQRVSGQELPIIALAALPFMAILVISLALMTIFPSIITYLPSLI